MKQKAALNVLISTTHTTTCNICTMTINKKQRVTLFLDPSLLKQAKIQALVENMSLSVLIERALAKYLPRETVIIKKGKGGDKK